MSVRLNPLHRLPDPENERVVYVPETAYRAGYTLKADFAVNTFPEFYDHDDDVDGNEYYYD